MSAEVETMITNLAAHDKVPAATKVRQLLEQSLVLLEDEALAAAADARMESGTKDRIAHSDMWAE